MLSPTELEITRQLIRSITQQGELLETMGWDCTDIFDNLKDIYDGMEDLNGQRDKVPA